MPKSGPVRAAIATERARPWRRGPAPGRAGSGPGDRRIEPSIGLPSGRAVVGGLLMAVAAVATFLAYQQAGQPQVERVYAARVDLRVGDVLAADDLTAIDVDLAGHGLGVYRDAGRLVGQVVTAPVAAGELVVDSAVAHPEEYQPGVEMTLTVPDERALGGAVRAGQHVDVFATWRSDLTEIIAVDATVLDVRADDGGALGAGTGLVSVRLGLADARWVDALVHAQAQGDLTLVVAAPGRSVGATYEPPAAAGSSRSSAGDHAGGGSPSAAAPADG